MDKKKRQRRGLLGVELHNAEIRLVETRISSGKPIVLTVGSTPMPPNALVDGEVVRTDAVALALRRLIESTGVKSTEAVLSVPMSGYATRSLKIPPAPPDEQAILIEGEVRHFDVLRTPDGAYDYFAVSPQDAGEVGIILFAAEGSITSSLRVVAEKAGLEVVALEPAAIGMLRAACGNRDSASDGLYVILGEGATEVSIVHAGKIYLYRRIDIGFNALFNSASNEAERIEHRVESQATGSLPPSAAPLELRKGPADTLATEVRRTIEFYAREFPDGGSVSAIRLLLNDPRAAAIERFLQDATHTEIRVIKPSGFVAQSDLVNFELSGELSYRYCTAFGLALHYAELHTPVPLMDLYVRERSLAALESKRRTMTGSLVGSIAAVVLGIVGTYYFGLQANREQELLEQRHKEVAELRGTQQASIAGDRRSAEQIAYLSKQGVPAVWFMDALTSSLDPGVGIKQVQFEEAGAVTVGGEATSEQALLLTVQRIQQHGGIGTAYVSSFERINRDSGNQSIRFQLRLIGPTGRVQVEGAKR